jgi:hypothetical protein
LAFAFGLLVQDRFERIRATGSSLSVSTSATLTPHAGPAGDVDE